MVSVIKWSAGSSHIRYLNLVITAPASVLEQELYCDRWQEQWWQDKYFLFYVTDFE